MHKIRLHIAILLFLSGMISTAFGLTLTRKIQMTIEDFIYSNVEADSLSVTFDANESPIDSQNADAVTIDILWTRPASALIGKATIPVQIIEGGEVIDQIYSTVRTRVFHRVWVADCNLSRHQSIDRRHVHAEMRETTDMVKTPLLSTDSVVGKRTRRVVAKDRILSMDMLETPPMVRRGDRVTVKLLHNNLEITLNAVAKEDGWSGDFIKVRDTRSGNELVAEVVSSSEVQVHYQ